RSAAGPPGMRPRSMPCAARLEALSPPGAEGDVPGAGVDRDLRPAAADQAGRVRAAAGRGGLERRRALQPGLADRGGQVDDAGARRTERDVDVAVLDRAVDVPGRTRFGEVQREGAAAGAHVAAFQAARVDLDAAHARLDRELLDAAGHARLAEPDVHEDVVAV